MDAWKQDFSEFHTFPTRKDVETYELTQRDREKSQATAVDSLWETHEAWANGDAKSSLQLDELFIPLVGSIERKRSSRITCRII